MINGRPVGPEKQGVSWGYQILPYLEQKRSCITSSLQLNASPVPMYVCPSRRAPVIIEDTKRRQSWSLCHLTDYVGAMPCGYSDYTQTTRYNSLGIAVVEVGPVDSRKFEKGTLFWADTATYVTHVPDDEIYKGVIVRTPYKLKEVQVPEEESSFSGQKCHSDN